MPLPLRMGEIAMNMDVNAKICEVLVSGSGKLRISYEGMAMKKIMIGRGSHRLKYGLIIGTGLGADHSTMREKLTYRRRFGCRIDSAPGLKQSD